MFRFFIGTSGYSYKHWGKGVFYPEGLPQKKWLTFYSQYFNAVELNVTFYRLPAPKVFQGWYERTPEDFHFIIKGSRLITHLKKLKDCGEAWEALWDRASLLKEKLAGILWQLPPSLKKDLALLEDFMGLVSHKTPHSVRHAIEFRHKSWLDEDTYQLLTNYRFGFCIAHSKRWHWAKAITTDFLYLRFHGSDQVYSSNYSDEELRQWADFVKQINPQELFVFFNNDVQGYAIQNALTFRNYLLG